MNKCIQFDQARPLDIIPMGRIALDFNPMPEDYYKPSSEVNVFTRYIGGSPANIAVGLAHLGKKVGFFGKVPDDGFGDFAINFFNKEGIDTSHITRCVNGEKMGLAFTEILSESESRLLMYRHGVADLMLSVSDIDENYIRSAKALLISGTALSQSPSREAVLKAAALARKNNTLVIFDIDYRPQNWKNQDEITAYYSTVAYQSDIILGSREEFTLTEQFILPGNTDDQASAKLWFSHHAKAVIIKHGKDGSNAFFCSGESYQVKPFPVKLLKSFGGGDGYASAFLSAILDGESYEKALSLGSASAAIMVASKNCSNDMPTKEALKKFETNAIMSYGEMVTPL